MYNIRVADGCLRVRYGTSKQSIDGLTGREIHAETLPGVVLNQGWVHSLTTSVGSCFAKQFPNFISFAIIFKKSSTF